MKHGPVLVMLLVAAIIFVGRWLGPSDLYDNDQPKTVAYTVDMVRHGRWLLPVDMLGRPATKPPMYNWVGAPFVAAGWHNEFALKLPSTLAAMLTLGLTWHAARRTAGRINQSGGAEHTYSVRAIASVACIALLANYSFSKLCYTARPDMVLTGFLTAGWVLATSLLRSTVDAADTKGGRVVMQAMLWLCVAGATLTKGPPALLIVLYVLLGGKLLAGQWGAIRETGIIWGLPLALLLTGLWAYGAYTLDPEHFKQVFLGYETVERVGRGGVIGVLSELWKMPAYFVAKFQPWSVFAIMGAWHVLRTRPRRDWFTHPVGPAMLWVVLVIAFFSLSGGKRHDYLAPAFPAASVITSFWLVCEGDRLLTLKPWQPAVVGLVVAMLIAAYDLTWSAGAVERYGDHAAAFVRNVDTVTCGERLAFKNTGYTPIQPLLGENQPMDATHIGPDAVWIIRPIDTPDAVLVSDPIWIGGERHDLRLGLYLNHAANGRRLEPAAE